MKYLPQLCALTLVIGFFLPIASVDQAEPGNGIKFNGVKLVEFGHLLKKMPDGALDTIGPLFDKVTPNLKSQVLKFSILLLALAVIPIVGLAAVLLDNKVAHIASGSITLVILGTWLTQLGEPIPVSLTFGTGLLIFAGITQLLTSGKSQENPLLLSGFEKKLISLITEKSVQQPDPKSTQLKAPSVWKFEHISRICALIILIGFFMPFLPFFSHFSGFNLVETGFEIAQLPKDSKALPVGELALLFSIFALIPIFSLVSIILDNKFAHLISGLAPVTLMIFLTRCLNNLEFPLDKLDISLINIISIGGWVSISAGLIQVLSTVKSQRSSMEVFISDAERFMVAYAVQIWGIIVVFFGVVLVFDIVEPRHLPTWLPKKIYGTFEPRCLPFWLYTTVLIIPAVYALRWSTKLRQKLKSQNLMSRVALLLIVPFALMLITTGIYIWFIWWSQGEESVSDMILWAVFTHAFVTALVSLGTFRAYALKGWGQREFLIVATVAFLPTWQWLVFATKSYNKIQLFEALYWSGLATTFLVGLAWTIRWVENRSRELQLQRRATVATGSLDKISPLDAMNRSIAPPKDQIWNPLDTDAWYYGRQRQKLKQSFHTFVGYSAVFIAIFLLLMSLSGCQEIYEMPAGGGEPELKQKVIKQIIKIKEIPIVNPLSNLIRPVPPIEEILKNMLEETMHRYEAGQGKGKGAGFAGGTRRGKVRFIRLRYAGGDWDQDLDLNSDLNMLLWYASKTGHPTAKLPEVRSIGQLQNFPKLKSPPLVYMTGERGLSISESEVEILREYIVDKHGMIFADNGGSSGWHSQFFSLMRRVLPNVNPRAIPIDHPVHSGLAAVPIVAPHGGRTAYGWVVESRIVAYYHPGDIGDAWADGHAGVPRQIWEAGHRLGANIILYAHSEYSKWLQAQKNKD